jgi:hypothetical protein
MVMVKKRKFTFTITRTQYFTVESDSCENARDVLENCDDLTEYEDVDYEIQPEFEFHSVSD